ncbi:hypothetical protein UFOVP1655_38 [uncultured Caudovirales phage]|uniref:Uncharacterized protein n=1 Tax=uncultured Caudovirales phage TaxID=2100421 RepID=A0A6J5T3D0_9CAUD|nr:hypothetical protein UFOVP1655_38 [uncultured Caudovirales phage]
MKSIYYYWYAKKRLAALKKDLLTMGDDNPMLEAQGDMIELEISYYKEESIKMLMITTILLLVLELLVYVFYNQLYTFVESLKFQLFYFMGKG